ncbi:MAG: EF-hand domain-containing protein [Bradyrhizobium sp.]|uniref:EF-hand domain-containing protein n=1 Tax=Bradyrhizobium sp. TaxID=376 RepID=UPI0025B8B824|nr:EF-hand domain-containing protein [Bradyrhizobium sp.]MBI5265332.1 EF-hand domain-containing protein [Bradyrhizobium sp.]
MLFALGAVSSAIDALQSLTESKSSSGQKTGFNHGPSNPFDIESAAAGGSASTSGTAGYGISPQTMSALLAAQGQSSSGEPTSPPNNRWDSLKDLFSLIDGNGDGQISKSEFENALGAGGTNLANADNVFSKLDADGDGSVSLNEMAKALMGRGHHHHHAGGANGANGPSSGDDGSNSDPLPQALKGASSTSVTNSDGSTTTTITYGDGSKVSMTTPAASNASSSATSSYNWIEKMIQREAQALSASAASSVSVTA